jgi:hypothetical protein
MSKSPKTRPHEPDPDGWQRFERAVDAALHTAPKHRESKEKPGPDTKPK